MMNPTLYEILGVSPDASRDEIKDAWRAAADRFEPGSGGSAQFRLFNETAEVLLDPERRRAYDDELAGLRRPVPPAADPAGGGPPTPQEPSRPGRIRLRRPGWRPGWRPRWRPGAAGAPAEDRVGAARGDSGGDRGGAPAEDRVGAPGVGPQTRGRGVPVPALVVLGVLAGLTAGLAVYLGVDHQRASAYQEALDRAPSSAERAAAAVLSYSHTSLEADRDAAAKFLTAGYRDDYEETFDSLVVDAATETKAEVEAEVLASSAMPQSGERTPGRVPVLLFVNQTTVSTANSGDPSVALNRVRFDMVEVDGTWLVDGITSY